MPILYGHSVFHMQRGELTTAYDVATGLQRAAERQDDSMALVTAHRMKGSALTQLGRLHESRQQFEAALRLHDPERHRDSALVYVIDSRVMCLSWLSHVLQLSGKLGAALEYHHEALSGADALGHVSTSVVALTWSCIYQQLRGDHRLAGVRAAEAVAAAAEHGFPLYRAAAAMVRGWARAQDGQVEAGLAEIGHGTADYAGTGAKMWRPYFLALQAEALRQAGNPPEALACVREARQLAQQTQARWIDTKLRRLEDMLRPAHGWAHSLISQ
jgi:predicted ATPase